MSQINLHVTKEFQDDLALLMRELKTRNKSDAIRFAVKSIAKYTRQIVADRQCAAGVVDTAPEDGAAAGAGADCAAGAGAAAPDGGGP